MGSCLAWQRTSWAIDLERSASFFAIHYGSASTAEDTWCAALEFGQKEGIVETTFASNAHCTDSLLSFETEPILFSIHHHHHLNVHWIILEFLLWNWVWFSSFCPMCACLYASSTLIFWSAREISCKSCFRGGRGTKTEQFWVTRRWLLVL